VARDDLGRYDVDAPGTIVPSLMTRIVNWPALLDVLSANWADFDGELGLALVDPLLAGPPVAAIVRGGTAPAVREADPTTLAGCAGGMIVGDVSAWSPVVTGHRSAGAACESGLLKASGAGAIRLVDLLFPARDPFLPTIDHF
jgi:hypothetical protein